MTGRQPNRTVLLVDDEEDLREVLSDFLSTCGFRVVGTGDGKSAITRLKDIQPDVVILDLMLPDINGFEVCKTIKAQTKGYLPVILLTARGDLDSLVDGLGAATADDYIVKPFRHAELLARIGACLRVKDIYDVIRQQNELLADLSVTDDLTGVYNRRHLTRKLDDRIRVLHEQKSRLSCVLLDLDNFKEVNDRHGHLSGDEVLRKFSKILQGTLNAGDICGRWGGDEFLIIFAEESSPADPKNSNSDQLLKEWSEKILEAIKSSEADIGISGGAATIEGPDRNLDAGQLISDLDRMLYQAKDKSRGRILVAAYNSIGRLPNSPKRKESTDGRACVFVLEDEPDICAIIRDMLARQKIETRTFHRTQEMMDNLKETTPDLILLDLRLDDGDGMEVCRTLRKMPDLKKTRISFLTAFTSDDVREKAMAAGADEFLIKPFTYSKFIEKINALLAR